MEEQASGATPVKPVTDYVPGLGGAVEGLPPLDWWRHPRTGELVGMPAQGDPDAAVAAFATWCAERAGGQYEHLTDPGIQTAFICRTVLGDWQASVRMIVPFTDQELDDWAAQWVAREVDRRLTLR